MTDGAAPASPARNGGARRGLGDRGQPASGALADVLDQLVRTGAAAVSATGSGIMFLDDEHVSRYVAATDDGGKVLEQAQADAGEGPCVQATVDGVVITTADVGQDPRWPRCAALLRGTPVVAVLGVPVRLSSTVIGSLDVYDSSPREWTPADVAAVESTTVAIGHVLAAAAAAERQDVLVAQLQHALSSRVVVERAVGMIMARNDEDAVAGFRRLRAAARSTRRPIAALADDVVERRTVV